VLRSPQNCKLNEYSHNKPLDFGVVYILIYYIFYIHIYIYIYFILYITYSITSFWSNPHHQSSCASAWFLIWLRWSPKWNLRHFCHEDRWAERVNRQATETHRLRGKELACFSVIWAAICPSWLMMLIWDIFGYDTVWSSSMIWIDLNPQPPNSRMMEPICCHWSCQLCGSIATYCYPKFRLIAMVLAGGIWCKASIYPSRRLVCAAASSGILDHDSWKPDVTIVTRKSPWTTGTFRFAGYHSANRWQRPHMAGSVFGDHTGPANNWSFLAAWKTISNAGFDHFHPLHTCTLHIYTYIHIYIYTYG